jgi:urease accessory protein
LTTSSILSRVGGAIALVVALAPPAEAHMMTTGFGPFYDGLAHLVSTPEVLLAVIALALLAGLRGARAGRLALFALPSGWIAGEGLGWLARGPAAPIVVAAIVMVALGALAALDAPLPAALVSAIAAAIGLSGGVQNGAEIAAAGASAPVAVGAACGLFAIMSLVAGQVASLQAPWARIVVRVAGSWIAAVGLLLLGWSLRPA